MNFWMLKHMVDNLISAYTCPFCWSKNISEKDIDIIWAAWNTVNIDMKCPSCKKHFMAKTEVIHMDTSSANLETLKKLSHTIKAIKRELGGDIDISKELEERFLQNPSERIADEAIVSLQKKLKQKNDISISDLFWDNAE